MYKLRIKRIRKELEKARVDALVVTDRLNIEYLTGFSGSYGFLLIYPNATYLFTDSRYYQRCKKEVSGVNIRLIKNDWWLPRRVKYLGFEACSVDYDTYRHWRIKFKGIRLVPTRFITERIRMIKRPEELRVIRKAAEITEAVLKRARRRLRNGISEIELAKKIEEWMRKVPDSLPAFPPIVAYGRNASMPHASVSKLKLKNNRLILIDLGAKFRGYSSDLTRTFWMGRITRKFREIYNIVLTAQQKAIEGIAPGKRISEIDTIARNYIARQGYGKYFGHPLGHGIGMYVHEIPRVGPKNDHFLSAGMVFSVEPGIYIPGWGGVRIEDMVLVNEDGCEMLTHVPKSLNDINIRR